MRHYETIYIINPNLSDDDYKVVTEKFNSLIEERKGVIIKTEKWGKQRLAYEVKKFGYGFYVLVDFCADPGVTSEFERGLKLDERVIKYQTIKLADKVDPQELILKEKEKIKEVPKTEDTPETTDELETLDEEYEEESEVNDGEE